MSQSQTKIFKTKEELQSIFREKAGEDMKLTLAELWDWLAGDGWDVFQMMKDLDKDKSGYIDEKEFLEELMKPQRREGLGLLFDEIDKDKSGELSFDEIRKRLQSTKQGSKILAEWDTDRILRQLHKMDSNKDGSITREEFIIYMDERY